MLIPIVKLHNQELRKLYFLRNIITMAKSWRMRWGEHVSCTGENRNAYRILVGNPEIKRLLGRPRRRWEDNNKMNSREIWLMLGNSGGLLLTRY
jgi:hypothetical protein